MKLIALLLYAALQSLPMGSRPHGSGGSPTVTYASNGCANSTATCTITGVTTGQTLLVDAQAAGASVTAGYTTLGDTVGGTISTISGPTLVTGGGNPFYETLFLIKNATAGNHVLTLSGAAGLSAEGIDAVVISGASTTSPIDSFTFTQGISFMTGCSSVTTTTANQLVFAFFSSPQGGINLSDPAMTNANLNTGAGMGASYINAPTSGTAVSSSWGQFNGDDWACYVVALH